MNDRTYYVSNGDVTTGPYQSEKRAEKRSYRWEQDTGEDWVVVTADEVLSDPDIPLPNTARTDNDDEVDTSQPLNYAAIRSSLEMILDVEAPDKKNRIVDSLEDAVGNNSDSFVFAAPENVGVTVTIVSEDGTMIFDESEYHKIEETVSDNGNTQLRVYDSSQDTDPLVFDHASVIEIAP